MVDMHQRIAAQAYQALRNALPTIMWQFVPFHEEGCRHPSIGSR